MEQAQQQEIKRKIKENPEMTEGEKGRELKRLSEPYKKMSDEELLQLVRDFVRECGREPTRKDMLCFGTTSAYHYLKTLQYFSFLLYLPGNLPYCIVNPVRRFCCFS